MKNILITAPPGAGKTTVIKKLFDRLSPKKPAGFYTAEIRERGIRKGFELIDLGGRRFILAHTNIRGAYRVGKYGVDISGFERYLVEKDFLNRAAKLLIIDEIGKMECISFKFVEFVRKALASDKTVIATVALKGKGLIEQVKTRPDIRLIEITPQNRNSIILEIIEDIA